jgi:RNA-binding protein
MALTGKERATLRSEAHHLDPLAHVGQQGITSAVLRSVGEVLRAQELVKIQVSRAAGISAKDAAPQLASALGAGVIQVIGRTLTLYKPKPADGGA